MLLYVGQHHLRTADKNRTEHDRTYYISDVYKVYSLIYNNLEFRKLIVV